MSDILLTGFDMESSGLDITRDRPVQIGLVLRLYENGNYTDYPVINMLCNPGKPIDPGAAAIHGISDAQVSNTPSAYDAVDYLAKTVAYYAQGREAYVCTYNGYSFDVPMANNTLGRQAFTIPHIDVLRMVRHKLPEVRGALGGKKLTELYEVFIGRPLENAHDAVADIGATLDLLDVLLDKTGMSLAELAEEQRTPRPYVVMPLGKYLGRRMEEVPRSWYQFMQSKQLDPDLRATVDAGLALA